MANLARTGFLISKLVRYKLECDVIPCSSSRGKWTAAQVLVSAQTKQKSAAVCVSRLDYALGNTWQVCINYSIMWKLLSRIPVLSLITKNDTTLNTNQEHRSVWRVIFTLSLWTFTNELMMFQLLINFFIQALSKYFANKLQDISKICFSCKSDMNCHIKRRSHLGTDKSHTLPQIHYT